MILDEIRDNEATHKQCLLNGLFTILSVEKPALVLESRPPSKDATHIQPFSFHMCKNLSGINPNGRKRVVGATRCMDVVISTVETVNHRVHPALQIQPKLEFAFEPLGYSQFLLQCPVLRPTAVPHGKLAGREVDDLIVGSINLALKKNLT